MSRYSDLMHDLNPRVILEKVEMPHNAVRASVTLQSPVARNYQDFEDLIVAFISYDMSENMGCAPPPYHALTLAKKILEPSVGFENAVFIGLSGSEGGMPKILDLLCSGLVQESKQAYFTYFIDRHISPLSFEEIVEVMAEFKQRLGNYSPEASQYINPGAMAANYKQIIWSYIESLSKYRNLWLYEQGQ